MPFSSLEVSELLAPQTEERRLSLLLGPAGFADCRTAGARLQRMASDPALRPVLDALLPSLLLALRETANPDQALVMLERFGQSVPERLALFEYLRAQPRAIEILLRLFAGSQFLTEIVLANPQYVERLTQHWRLADLKSVQQLHSEAQAALAGLPDSESKLNALRRFQRWELLRIGVCDFFGLLDLRRVTVQLSLLADSLVQSCLEVAAGDSAQSLQGLSVIALGKLGGEELNYSSDIDLLFLAESSSVEQRKIGQRLIQGLSAASAGGFLYRVDMRLRPWGRAGELVSALDGHLGYLADTAQLWEKQALLKARVIAGDMQLGQEFLRRARPLLFTAPREQVRSSVRGMKQRIEDGLQKKGRLWGEVKLGAGSIRDIEFIAQYLQLVHGAEYAGVCTFNTLDALVRLADHSFLQADEYRVLTDGYVFLRTVEHSLQLMHNKQTHELPQDPAELTYLARRLDFASGPQFLEHYHRHCTAVRAVYQRYLGADEAAERGVDAAAGTKAARPEVTQHMARMEQAYANTFSEPDIEHHAALAEKIGDQRPVVVDAQPLADGDWRVTIVGYDYLGELSVICGLLLAYEFNIINGQVFTYEPLSAEPVPPTAAVPKRVWRSRSYKRPYRKPEEAPQRADVRQKIVDVFTVRPARGVATAEVWSRYAEELTGLLSQLKAGQTNESQGTLVKRVAATLRSMPNETRKILYPIQIDIDNETSEHYTLLQIRTRDTLGFLYELTNALALNGIYISRVNVFSAGDDVCDTLYVTDAHGQKIVEPSKQWELQSAVVLTKHFTHLLPQTPNPEAALLHFREFVAQLFTRPEWPDEIASLERTEVLDALARLLGVSDFLWNDFLRMQHANLFPVVRDVDALASAKAKSELAAELQADIDAAVSPVERRQALNAFKDREMFRVDMRHILGYVAQFGEFSAELSDVAEVVVEAACRICEQELREQFGEPRDGAGGTSRWSVLALGKFGGRELGFASDIELMFVYAGEGRTTGSHSIAASEYFIRLVEGLALAIQARREGIFEIDLRLRPYGRAGSLAVSLEAFRNYFGPEGAAWPFERQALVKLRPVAGDALLGQELLAMRDAFVYSGDRFDVAAMRGMRERQARQLVVPGTLNAKLSPGGLVDIEYLVQGLQITHAHRHADLRATNTLEALAALARHDLLGELDHDRLRAAYDFLRNLIGALRIVRGNARDLTIPPADSEEFAFLARRLGYEGEPIRLRDDLALHMGNVQGELSELMPQ